MASINKRAVSDGSIRYDVVYRDPESKQRRKTFRRKADATRFAAIVEADKSRGDYIDPDGGRETFRAFADRHQAAKVYDVTTRQAVEIRMRLHVYPVLGSMPLAAVKPSTIQAWLRGLDGLATTYRRVIFANVSAVFAAAVDDGLIRVNPCRVRSVKAPTIETRKVIPWTREQLLAVREAMPTRYRIAATLAAGLGLRQGEVFGLAVEDVDFLRGTVEVRRQVRIVGSRLVFALPKTEKCRTVPLPGSVRDALAAHLAVFPAVPVTLPWRDVDGAATTARLILTSREAKPLNRNYINTAVWKPALIVAGIDPTRENGFHALRHTYASMLLDGGESIRAVSEYLGHADPGFTLRVYTHLMPSSAERTRRAVDDVLGCDMGVTSDAAEAE